MLSAVAACGGAGGYYVGRLLLDRWLSSRASKSLEKCVAAIDELAMRLCSPESVAHSREVERWALHLYGTGSPTRHALRLAARGYCLREETRQVICALRMSNADEQLIKRVIMLLTRTGESDSCNNRGMDFEESVLQDAIGVAFFASRHQVESAKDEDAIQRFTLAWTRMGHLARSIVLSFEYGVEVFGCLLVAVASAEHLEANALSLGVPRLPTPAVREIQRVWAHVSPDSFGFKCKEWFLRTEREDRLHNQLFEPSLEHVLRDSAVRPSHIWKFVKLVVDHLDTEHLPWTARLIHGMTAVCQSCGKVRSMHLAVCKRGFVRVAVSFMPPEDKKQATRLFEALFYIFASVAAPHLVMTDKLEEVGQSTSTVFPSPGGAPHSASMATNGVGLLEMCLTITAAHRGQRRPPSDRLPYKLREARCWLMQLMREEINSNCAHLAAVCVSSINREYESGNEHVLMCHRRCVEVPLRIAEVCVGTAVSCLHYDYLNEVVPSLHEDWLAGMAMMRTATENTMDIAQFHLQSRPNAHSDLERRLQRLKDVDPPWDDL
eukprot:TRINITY_DN22559_c0_g1_i1.p1 TRINITY_DN22559_c0_g1~~TRINITY_DN22559_c0_g1_i1.p1  ORF type:complete len:611 (-),score=54.61 TRINITY_DN22559_c0_g1_i1:89-1738(-)